MFEFILHSKRVSNISIEFFDFGKISCNRNDLKTAALLHDIGKVHIPNSILNKPSKLSDLEMDTMKSHVKLGVDHLTKGLCLPFEIDSTLINDNVLRIILHHHENADGSGYFGLNSEQVNVEAKILRIIDSFDALTSKRVYKKAYSKEYAIKQMIKDSSNYDAELFAEFIRYLETKELLKSG